MEEDNGWALSDLKQTEICVLGEHMPDGGVSHVESYLIKVPDPEARPPPDYFSCSIFKLKDKKKPSFSPKELSSLPASNKDKPWASKYFAVIGNMLYDVGGRRETFHSGEDISDVPEDYEDVRYRNYIPTKDFWILDLTSPDEGWNAGPPMKYRRYNPKLIVVNGKLYVFGGLGFKPKGSLGWMEVFDPLQGTWESLPNPPSFDIYKEDTIYALLDTEAKQEIIVAEPTRTGYSKFYRYDVMRSSWKKLKPSPYKRFVSCLAHIGKAVVVDRTLYWASFVSHEELDKCYLYSYDLMKDTWLEGYVSTRKIFGEGEWLNALCAPGFLHLSDKKFCLILTSFYLADHEVDVDMAVNYLYCIIFELQDDDDRDSSLQWSVSILSIQKYLMDKHVKLLDCMILDGGVGFLQRCSKKRKGTVQRCSKKRKGILHGSSAKQA